jgi:hypothetical protein
MSSEIKLGWFALETGKECAKETFKDVEGRTHIMLREEELAQLFAYIAHSTLATVKDSGKAGLPVEVVVDILLTQEN